MSSALISSEQALNDYFTALLDEETANLRVNSNQRGGSVRTGSCGAICT